MSIEFLTVFMNLVNAHTIFPAQLMKLRQEWLSLMSLQRKKKKIDHRLKRS